MLLQHSMIRSIWSIVHATENGFAIRCAATMAGSFQSVDRVWMRSCRIKPDRGIVVMTKVVELAECALGGKVRDARPRLRKLTELEIRKAVAELRGFTDAELDDLGIGRGEIETAVRYGRPGIDRPDGPARAA